MEAVWMRARAELRGRARGSVALVLMIGVLGGALIAVAAGARRTSSAYPRFAERTRAVDVMFPGSGRFFGFAQLDFDVVARLPQVHSAVETSFTYAFLKKEGSEADLVGTVLAVQSPDGIGDRIDRVQLVEGRHPRPDRPHEVLLGYATAQRFGVRPGDRVQGVVGTAEALQRFSAGDLTPIGVPLTLTVTGIGATVGELPPASTRDSGFIHVSAELVRSLGQDVVVFPVLFVRIDGGVDGVAAFQRAVEARAIVGPKRPLGMSVLAERGVVLQRSIGLQATALWILVALAGLTLALVVGQGLLRQIHLDATEYPLLRALGMSAGQVFAVAVLRTLSITFIGGVLAVAFAWVLSPLFPIGLARVVEIPGARFDALVLLGGGALAVLAPLAVVSLSIWRAATIPASSQGVADLGARSRPSVLAGIFARWSMSPAAVSGVRLALEPGHGRTAVPVRAALFGTAAAIAALGAAVVFGSSLQHLAATPALYGWDWDDRFGDIFLPDVGDQVEPVLREHPAVADAASGTFLPIVVNDRRTDGIALDVVRGSIGVRVLEGRRPQRPDEIVLGTSTLARASASVGDEVEVGVGSEAMRMRVVGRGVFAESGALGGLGEGAAITFDGLRALAPASPKNIFLVRWDRDAPAAQVAALRGELVKRLQTADAQAPQELLNFGQVDALPLILGGILGALGLATLAHTLLTSVRRRRRDLAVLRTLGFLPRQVAATVAWQGTTLAVVALLVGVPVGIAGGRWLWTVFADEVGVPAVPVVPMLAVALAIPAVILVANVLALVPGALAARLHPARILRAVD